MWTPSSSSSWRWTAAPTGSWIAIRPRFAEALPITRCHGSRSAGLHVFNAAPATRAPPGKPASSATWP
jgi:hypothetical protein